MLSETVTPSRRNECRRAASLVDTHLSSVQSGEFGTFLRNTGSPGLGAWVLNVDA